MQQYSLLPHLRKHKRMERTLIILKPSCIQRGLIGKVISRFEQKGLKLVAMKMSQLNDEILDKHYAHLKEKPFFAHVKKSMMSCPVVLMSWEGKDAVKVVRNLTGFTNGREAIAGTIRGDFSVSTQENIIHASDSVDAAKIELERFFDENELYNYKLLIADNLYSNDEI